MKPISATVGAEGRRDYFWLDGSAAMTAESLPGVGSNPSAHFGGIFTSAPVAVGTMARRDPIISTGGVLTAGKAVPAGGAVIGTDAPATIVGVPASGVGVTTKLTQRTDMFGLGRDYALYHKRFWGRFDHNDRGPWPRLGGVFTSAPAAIVWAGGRVDVFGVGMDHAMYTKTNINETWTPRWREAEYRNSGRCGRFAYCHFRRAEPT